MCCSSFPISQGAKSIFLSLYSRAYRNVLAHNKCSKHTHRMKLWHYLALNRCFIKLDAVESSSLPCLEFEFLDIFCILKLMCPGLFHAILWHQCTRLTAAAILCHALIFPLWRLQVPLSDTVLIAFSWSWCICEPPVCTGEHHLQTSWLAFLSKATVAAVWIYEYVSLDRVSLIVLLHPGNG